MVNARLYVRTFAYTCVSILRAEHVCIVCVCVCVRAHACVCVYVQRYVHLGRCSPPTFFKVEITRRKSFAKLFHRQNSVEFSLASFFLLSMIIFSEIRLSPWNESRILCTRTYLLTLNFFRSHLFPHRISRSNIKYAFANLTSPRLWNYDEKTSLQSSNRSYELQIA